MKNEDASKNSNPLYAIKEFCYRCSGDSYAEVKRCSAPDCPLFPFKTGKNPYRKKREMTQEQKENASERLANARKRKGNTKNEIESDA